MNTYRDVQIQPHTFLSSVLDGCEICDSCYSYFTLEQALCTHWIGGSLGPRAALDTVEEEKNFCMYPRCAMELVFLLNY